ncbi:hypothetical protein [Cohnella rhizosphaerae]|uniref:Uncharacterized protein n=1 Tax=Cohnella rhizosphaerae TaxID=1457232 RepID=A0A9X4KZF1_9BACL|nr:hypothetical protein [Cohnella rhizosphaerae]MDG0810592.1 hypothetical protein [Cohnella rhizosphaerae]
MRTRRLYAKIWMLLGALLLVVQGGLPAAVQAATITYGATTVAGTTGSSGFFWRHRRCDGCQAEYAERCSSG